MDCGILRGIVVVGADKMIMHQDAFSTGPASRHLLDLELSGTEALAFAESIQTRLGVISKSLTLRCLISGALMTLDTKEVCVLRSESAHLEARASRLAIPADAVDIWRPCALCRLTNPLIITFISQVETSLRI